MIRRIGYVLAALTVLTAAVLLGHHRPAVRHAPAAISAPRVAHIVTVPRAVPTIPTAPHDLVAAAVPVRFEISGPAFTIRAAVCPMPYVRPLDPPGDQRHTVCWVEHGFGVAPASDAAGTTYVLGHAWAEAPLVLNALSIFAMNHVDRARPRIEAGVRTYTITALDGYAITLRTRTGVLRYTIHRAFSVAKEQAGLLPTVMDVHTPRRVVLITCAVHDGVDVDENVIAFADLTSSTAART